MSTPATTRRIPFWAYMLVLLVLLVLISYIIARFQIPVDGAGSKLENNECTITVVKPDSPAEIAGLLPGDIIKSVGSSPVNGNGHLQLLESYRAGDTIIYVIERNREEISVTVKLVSFWSQNYWFYTLFYLLILTVCTTSIYLLYKKPYDPTVRIFFIFLQLFAIAQNFKFLNISS